MILAPQVHYILKQINKGLDFLTQPLINENLIATLINTLSQTLIFTDEEKKKIVKHSTSLEDYDDEKKEEIEQRYEEINNLMQSNHLIWIFSYLKLVVMEISGRLLKLYGPKIEGLIGNGIAPYYYNFLVGNQNSISPHEILYSVCLFIDILEYCSEDVIYSLKLFLSYLN